MRISEIYHSVQGEGLLTGTPSVFIRTSGCNLRCWFCDTPYASWNPEGENWHVNDVLERVLAWPCQHVVITGGEPMLVAELPSLCASLRGAARHITIETAATVYQELDCDLISISPKLGNSTPTVNSARGWHERHERARHRPDIVVKLMESHPYQLKFVVDSLADAEEVLEYLRLLKSDLDRDRILLMPQAMTVEQIEQRSQWLIPWCRDHELRYCDRAHLRWFGAIRGT